MSWFVDVLFYDKPKVSVDTIAEKIYFDLFTGFDDIFNPNLTNLVT